MTDPYAYYSNAQMPAGSGRSNGSVADDWYYSGGANQNAAQPATTSDGITSSDISWGQFDYNNQQNQSFDGASGGYMNSYAPTVSPGTGGLSPASYYTQNQQPNLFIPSMNSNAFQQEKGFDEDFDNEPPLLEELGINFDHIRQKTLAVLNPVGTATADVIADQDLAGPLVFCLLFGASLLLHGKIHFGHIYGIGLVGCVGMYALLNLMAAEERAISFTCTASVLGYCLLPMALLSLMAAVLSLQGLLGYALVLAAVFWSGSSSSKLFSITLQMQGQRLLVAYPCTLLYSVFALLAIF